MNAKFVSEENKPSCVIVGIGSIGHRHLQILDSSGKVQVFAFPVRMRPRPDLQAKNFPILENWNQVRDLNITHAIIATDTGRHPADIQSALDAGCSLLVEKPMAVDARAAFQNLRDANNAKRDLWVGCCMRFQQALNVFREQLPQIGEIHSVRIECQSYLPDWRPQRPYQDSYSARLDEGGVLRDLIHEIDYAGWLYGWPKSVMAKIRTTRALGIDAEDTADVLWETENGTVISITLDYLSRPARRQMRAFGKFGMLEWDGIQGRVTLSLNGEQSLQSTSSQTRDEMYLAQDIAFIQADLQKNNFDNRLATGADGVRALAICDAARESSLKKHETQVFFPESL